MLKLKYISAGLCASLLCVSLPVGATVIDFNSAPGTSSGGFSIGPTYTEDGYQLSVAPGDGLFSMQDGAQNNRFSRNGTTTAFTTSGGAGFQLSRVGGAAFNLQSIDVAELFNNGDFAFSLVGRTVSFVGNLSGGGSVFSSFDLDLISDGIGGAADFETVSFSAVWSNLVSVDVSAVNGSYLDVDNITVSEAAPVTVTEPGMLALFGFGLAGIGYARRKRAA